MNGLHTLDVLYGELMGSADFAEAEERFGRVVAYCDVPGPTGELRRARLAALIAADEADETQDKGIHHDHD